MRLVRRSKVKKPNKSAGPTPPRKVSSTSAKVTIHNLSTGVPGLDDILGGGIPEFLAVTMNIGPPPGV
jgi:RecA/RadA recombinase